ncbi:MAG: ketoacyl-ACP synthase III [Deltaproteobacteria bacterium]|nr:ketoacyl-ACP synthase III [Deltaproteobacteria bacterium]
MKRTAILGTGHYVPPRVVTNQELEKLMDTTDEWIVQRTGIRERRFVDPGVGPAELAENAARAAVEDAALRIQDIDFIILATLSPQHNFPGTSCFLQEKLGHPGIGALDIRTQCTGFLYALSIADQFIKTGMYQRILVVGAEVHSTGIDLSTRGRDVAVLFGDGAGAFVLGASDDPNRGILSTHLHADGRFARDLWLEAPGSVFQPRMTVEMVTEGKCYPQMNGKKVFTSAVKKFPEVMREALVSNKKSKDDVDLYILHQANLRIVQAAADLMEIPQEKFFNNIERYGNTTAASIPIAFNEAKQAGRIKNGDLVMLAAFGSGYTWASALLRM